MSTTTTMQRLAVGQYRKDFMSLPMVLGRSIELILANGEKRKGQFALVQLSDIIASHQQGTFASSQSYPLNAQGYNINDRNYADDAAAQAKVIDVAKNLEPPVIINTSRTVAGTPVISTDGFVVSGNNRTMSLKLAAGSYPVKYEEYKKFLLEEIESFGISHTTMMAIMMGDQVVDERHQAETFTDNRHIRIKEPVLVRIDYDFPAYTTAELSKYNKDGQKAERPIDKAIKLSNIFAESERCRIVASSVLSEYENISDFYKSTADQKKIVDTLLQCNIVNAEEIVAYYSPDGFNSAGKELLETLMSSLVLERDALKASEMDGVKRYRQLLITSLPVLIANASLPEGSLKKQINEAILFQKRLSSSGLRFGEYIRQYAMFEQKDSQGTVEINRLMDAGPRRFKKALEQYNASVSGNQAESLFGDKPSLSEIYDKYIRESLEAEVLQQIKAAQLPQENAAQQIPAIQQMPQPPATQGKQTTVVDTPAYQVIGSSSQVNKIMREGGVLYVVVQASISSRQDYARFEQQVEKHSLTGVAGLEAISSTSRFSTIEKAHVIQHPGKPYTILQCSLNPTQKASLGGAVAPKFVVLYSYQHQAAHQLEQPAVETQQAMPDDNGYNPLAEGVILTHKHEGLKIVQYLLNKGDADDGQFTTGKGETVTFQKRVVLLDEVPKVIENMFERALFDNKLEADLYKRQNLIVGDYKIRYRKAATGEVQISVRYYGDDKLPDASLMPDTKEQIVTHTVALPAENQLMIEQEKNCHVVRNEAKNGIEISFKSKPPFEVLAKVKSNGFRWSKFQKLWYATYNAIRLAFASEICSSGDQAALTRLPEAVATLGRLITTAVLTSKGKVPKNLLIQEIKAGKMLASLYKSFDGMQDMDVFIDKDKRVWSDASEHERLIKNLQSVSTNTHWVYNIYFREKSADRDYDYIDFMDWEIIYKDDLSAVEVEADKEISQQQDEENLSHQQAKIIERQELQGTDIDSEDVQAVVAFMRDFKPEYFTENEVSDQGKHIYYRFTSTWPDDAIDTYHLELDLNKLTGKCHVQCYYNISGIINVVSVNEYFETGEAEKALALFERLAYGLSDDYEAFKDYGKLWQQELKFMSFQRQGWQVNTVITDRIEYLNADTGHKVFLEKSGDSYKLAIGKQGDTKVIEKKTLKKTESVRDWIKGKFREYPASLQPVRQQAKDQIIDDSVGNQQRKHNLTNLPSGWHYDSQGAAGSYYTGNGYEVSLENINGKIEVSITKEGDGYILNQNKFTDKQSAYDFAYRMMQNPPSTEQQEAAAETPQLQQAFKAYFKAFNQQLSEQITFIEEQTDSDVYYTYKSESETVRVIMAAYYIAVAFDKKPNPEPLFKKVFQRNLGEDFEPIFEQALSTTQQYVSRLTVSTVAKGPVSSTEPDSVEQILSSIDAEDGFGYQRIDAKTSPKDARIAYVWIAYGKERKIVATHDQNQNTIRIRQSIERGDITEHQQTLGADQAEKAKSIVLQWMKQINTKPLTVDDTDEMIVSFTHSANWPAKAWKLTAIYRMSKFVGDVKDENFRRFTFSRNANDQGALERETIDVDRNFSTEVFEVTHHFVNQDRSTGIINRSSDVRGWRKAMLTVASWIGMDAKDLQAEVDTKPAPDYVISKSFLDIDDVPHNNASQSDGMAQPVTDLAFLENQEALPTNFKLFSKIVKGNSTHYELYWNADKQQMVDAGRIYIVDKLNADGQHIYDIHHKAITVNGIVVISYLYDEPNPDRIFDVLDVMSYAFPLVAKAKDTQAGRNLFGDIFTKISLPYPWQLLHYFYYASSEKKEHVYTFAYYSEENVNSPSTPLYTVQFSKKPDNSYLLVIFGRDVERTQWQFDQVSKAIQQAKEFIQTVSKKFAAGTQVKPHHGITEAQALPGQKAAIRAESTEQSLPYHMNLQEWQANPPKEVELEWGAKFVTYSLDDMQYKAIAYLGKQKLMLDESLNSMHQKTLLDALERGYAVDLDQFKTDHPMFYHQNNISALATAVKEAKSLPLVHQLIKIDVLELQDSHAHNEDLDSMVKAFGYEDRRDARLLNTFYVERAKHHDTLDKEPIIAYYIKETDKLYRPKGKIRAIISNRLPIYVDDLAYKIIEERKADRKLFKEEDAEVEAIQQEPAAELPQVETKALEIVYQGKDGEFIREFLPKLYPEAVGNDALMFKHALNLQGRIKAHGTITAFVRNQTDKGHLLEGLEKEVYAWLDSKKANADDRVSSNPDEVETLDVAVSTVAPMDIAVMDIAVSTVAASKVAPIEQRLSLMVNGNFFKKHPEKVLAEAYQTSGRYGEVTKYKGDLLQSLSRIPVKNISLPADINVLATSVGATVETATVDTATSVGATVDTATSVGDTVISLPVSSSVMQQNDDDFLSKALSHANEEISTKAIASNKRKSRREGKGKPVDERQSLAGELDIFSAQQVADDYNPGFTSDDYKIFAYYKQGQGMTLKGEFWDLHNYIVPSKLEEYVQQGKLFYYQGELLPEYIYFAENLYEKKGTFERETSVIADKYGQAVADHQQQRLKEVFDRLYAKRLMLNKELPEDDRLIIDVLSKFSKEFTVNSLNVVEEFKIKKVTASTKKTYGEPDYLEDDRATDNSYGREAKRESFETLNLQQAFCYWITRHRDEVPFKGITYAEIISIHIQNKPRPTDYDKTAWSRLKAKAKSEADRLFQVFLSDVITEEDRLKIESSWNMRFNSYVNIDYTRVPVAFRMAKTYRDATVDIRSEKRDAVTFMLCQGSGALIYDVGFGKAQPLSAKILTPTGWTTMGALQPGDLIVGANGKPTKVVQIHPQGEKDIYRVCFSDGSFTEACAEHLWKVQTINHRSKYKDSYYVKTTEEIATSIRSYRGLPQYSIPMVEAVAFEKQNLPIHPYLMGVLIGDGMMQEKAIVVSTADPEILEHIALLLPEGVETQQTNQGYDYRLRKLSNAKTNLLLDELRLLQLAGKKSYEKFIPDCYKYTSVDDRLELLRGLMDTDGTVGRRKAGCHLSFTTTSYQLTEDMKFLIQSLGGTVSLYSRVPSYSYNGEIRKGRMAYTLTLSLPAHIIPFKLGRKLSKFIPRSKYQPSRYITEVVPVGKKQAQCISVDAEDHLYVTDDFVVTHNTWSAIFTIGQFIDAGLCKRPFIVVPNQVYKQFVGEIKGLLPHLPVNEIYNLSEPYLENIRANPVQDYSISVLTYEGFASIGFSDATADKLIKQFYNILNQGDAEGAMSKKKSQKQTEGFFEKLQTLVGKGLRGTVIDIEEMGFDFMCVDEAHNMKKVFTTVKGQATSDNKRERTQYKINSGSPSNLALKGFMISQYIMLNNNMRNVLLLTATPFTNSPLEVYSMLALIAYQDLERQGIDNINTFFDNFVDVSDELVINSKLEPVRKQIIKGFRNKPALQSFIFRYMDRKDINTSNAKGEKVNIKRPNKYVLPLRTEIVDGQRIVLSPEDRIETSLPLSPVQTEIMSDIKAYASAEIDFEQLCQAYDTLQAEGDQDEDQVSSEEESLDFTAMDSQEKLGVRLLRANNMGRNIALSPYLYKCSVMPAISAVNYVETSPKLHYVMKCIASVKAHHEKTNTPISGQVIYMDRGIAYFTLLREYLIEHVGFKAHEVGIIRSNMTGLAPSGVKTSEAKEYVKNMFLGQKWNEHTKEFDDVSDSERIKVVIGSGTIKEGINLQRFGTVLYNCFLDWNPTDVVQLEGRIWRQGNFYSNVRIVNIMMENSTDIFMFQKLEEKTERINQIWETDGRGRALNLDDFNPSELKYQLITDPKIIAELEIEEEEVAIRDEKGMFENRIKTAEKVQSVFAWLGYNKRNVYDELENFGDLQPIEQYEIKEMISKLNAIARTGKALNGMTLKEWFSFGGPGQSKLKARYMRDYYDFDYAKAKPQWFAEMNANVRLTERFQKNFLTPNNLTVEQIPYYITDLQQQIAQVDKRVENLRSEDAVKARVMRIYVKREEDAIESRSVEQRVSEFASLNYLLDDRKVPSVKKDVDVEPSLQEINDAIEGLLVMLEFEQDEQQREQLQDAYDGLQVLSELSQVA